MQVKSLEINHHKWLDNFIINFNVVDGGSSTILIGENGTGKSTLLRYIFKIIASFDSPTMAENIGFNYKLEYLYAGKNVIVEKEDNKYTITFDNESIQGSYDTVSKSLKKKEIRLFPQRVVVFYSGLNNLISPSLDNINSAYKGNCTNAVKAYMKSQNTGEEYNESFPKKKYICADEDLTEIYLSSILAGCEETFEKKYLMEKCNFSDKIVIYVVIKTERLAIFSKFNSSDKDSVRSSLMNFINFVEPKCLSLDFRIYSSNENSVYFRVSNISEIDADSITIYNFLEKLSTILEATYEVFITANSRSVSCHFLSEGQRQLIKIFGILGVCKKEDCLVLMDEPDAHMNPKWKYELKSIIDETLKDAINTQAIIATHDPLVINGVDKEFIRIFVHNENFGREDSCISKVVEPISDTEGMGIDGILQSEYYGLQTVLDPQTQRKVDEKRNLIVKKVENTISPEEKLQLDLLTQEIESMNFISNIPTDNLYDEYVAAIHKIYASRPKVVLSSEDIKERNALVEEILRGLLKK